MAPLVEQVVAVDVGGAPGEALGDLLPEPDEKVCVALVVKHPAVAPPWQWVAGGRAAVAADVVAGDDDLDAARMGFIQHPSDTIKLRLHAGAVSFGVCLEVPGRAGAALVARKVHVVADDLHAPGFELVPALGGYPVAD